MTGELFADPLPERVRAVVLARRPLSSDARVRLLVCIADCAWAEVHGTGVSGAVWAWSPFAPACAVPDGDKDLRRAQRRHLAAVADRFGGLSLPELASAARDAVENVGGTCTAVGV